MGSCVWPTKAVNVLELMRHLSRLRKQSCFSYLSLSDFTFFHLNFFYFKIFFFFFLVDIVCVSNWHGICLQGLYWSKR